MRRVFIVSIVILMFVAFAFPETEQQGLKIGVKAPTFSLEDAHDKKFSLKKDDPRIVLIVFGNRETREEADKWALAISEEFVREIDEERVITAWQVGDISGKPFFIPRSFVKRFLKRNKTPLPMLLDWEKEVTEKYAVPNEKAAVYLIVNGIIAGKLMGDFDKEKFAQVAKLVRSKLMVKAESFEPKSDASE